MTKFCLSLAALAMTAALAPALWAQQAKGGGAELKGKEKKVDKSAEDFIQDLKKTSLDELLAKAIKGNPDIKVAESKVRDAEVELNRTRMQVMQKVTMVYYEIRAAEAAAKEADARLARAQVLFKAGNMPEEEFGTYRLAAQKYRADLATKEAELPYLVGKQSGGVVTAIAFTPDGKLLAAGSDNTVRLWDATTGKLLQGVADNRVLAVWDLVGAAPVKGAMADKIRQALDAPIKVEMIQRSPLDVIQYLSEKVKDVNFVFAAKKTPIADGTVFLREAVPLGAALQLFEDTFSLKIVVREYGLVVSEPDRLPSDAVPLMQFWKSAPQKVKPSAP